MGILDEWSGFWRSGWILIVLGVIRAVWQRIEEFSRPIGIRRIPGIEQAEQTTWRIDINPAKRSPTQRRAGVAAIRQADSGIEAPWLNHCSREQQIFSCQIVSSRRV
jgi:hypothetical protein